MLNNLIGWSINNRVPVVLIALAFVFATAGLWQRMDVDVLPEFAPPEIVIQTEAPGLVAEEVESLISMPLESSVNGTPGVTSVRSLSMSGISKVTIYFQDGTNIYVDRQLVQEKIQLVVPTLPLGVGTPTMEPVMSELGDVLKLGITSASMNLQDLRSFADWQLKNRLLSVPGVARVVVYGGEQRQFQVLVDPMKLRSAGVTGNSVVSAVKACNTVAPAGFIVTRDRVFTIRGVMRAKSVKDIEEAVILSRNGVPLKIKHVASVILGPAFQIGDALINRDRGVEIVVTKQPFISTLALTKRLRDVLNDEQRLNPNLKFVSIFRQADFIEQSISNMMSSIWLGAAVVVVVLIAFLLNWRTAFISLSAIPMSLLCAMSVLTGLGGSVNTMTLGGLAIAVGEVVDDAVVDVENVFRRLRENRLNAQPKDPLRVIYEACGEVRGSVVYATFVVALVFLPVLTLTGVEGKLFGQLGIAYVAAIVCSLIVALILTPALSAILFGKTSFVPAREPVLVSIIRAAYSRLLKLCLAFPSYVVAAAIVLFVASLALLPFMGHAFLPKFDERDLMVPTSAMAGQSLNASIRLGKVAEREMLDGAAAAVGQRAGRTEMDEDAAAASFSEFDVRLKPNESLQQGSEKIRKILDQIPGISYEVASFLNDHINDVLSGGTEADLVIKIFGPDTATLRSLARQVAAQLKSVDGMLDVTPEQQILVPEVDIKINRDKAARYGISSADLSSTVEIMLGGPVVSQILENGRLYGLRVWGSPSARSNLEDIKSLSVDTADGGKIPLSEFTDVSMNEGPNAIVRENVNRRITVMANIDSQNVVGIVNRARMKIEHAVHIPEGYYMVYSGQYAAQQSSTTRLGLVSLLALVGILILLSQGLGSLRSALLVAANLPLAAIGGIIAVALTGNVLSIGSLIGFISLFGISTRNSLLLVSRINQLLNEGVAWGDALLTGCLDRVVPVLMTALTAALGMLPLAVQGGSGRELEQPLAIVIIGGLISSTALTLVVIPALYKLVGHKTANSAFPDSEEE